MFRKKKLGLVLGSGGARGWAHIGFINALEDAGIVPEIVTGCSAGSLIGAAYVSGNIEKIKTWVLSLNLINMANYFDITLSQGGLINGDKLLDFFYKEIGEIEYKNLNKKFAIVATEYKTGKEIHFTSGDVISHVRASISLPGLFIPQKINNTHYIDGGLVNPLPVNLCKKLGASKILAVNLNDINSLSTKQIPKYDLSFLNKLEEKTNFEIKDKIRSFFNLKSSKNENISFLDTIARSIDIIQDSLTKANLIKDNADIIVNPKVLNYSILDFHKGKELIQIGKNAFIENKDNILKLLK